MTELTVISSHFCDLFIAPFLLKMQKIRENVTGFGNDCTLPEFEAMQLFGSLSLHTHTPHISAVTFQILVSIVLISGM